jgi:hypothetical protein
MEVISSVSPESGLGSGEYSPQIPAPETNRARNNARIAPLAWES